MRSRGLSFMSWSASGSLSKPSKTCVISGFTLSRPFVHERGQLFHPQPSARHETAVYLLVAHPDAPLRTRQAHIFSAAEIIDISDSSAWLQDFYDRNERIDIAACDDCTVNTSSTSQFQNLPIDGAIFIADEIGSTVLSRCIYADGPRSDCEDSGCAAERCPCHRHQSDRADADYEHGITKLYVCEFCAVKNRSAPCPRACRLPECPCPPADAPDCRQRRLHGNTLQIRRP